MHVAVALNDLGGVLESRSFPADRGGYDQLLDWAGTLGGKLTFAIEGTGSYGAGLASAVRRRDIGVIEVSAPIDATGGCAASPTPSTPRTPPAPSSSVTPRPSPKPRTAASR